jgi:dihydrofolate synthase/folylpolyglutamate synthase
MGDAGVVNGLALTTDSFVVKPIRFPGGSIGDLAVNGTVNDLAVAGARPQALTLSLVLEEGLPAETLRAEVDAIARAAAAAGAIWMPRGDTWDAIVYRRKLHYRDDRGKLQLPLPRLQGAHQAMNAALAIAMLRHQQVLFIPETALKAAMGLVDWPARMQRLTDGPLTRLLPERSEFWIDGGHNPSAARAIARWARNQLADGLPLVLLFASVASKDPKRTLLPFAGLAKEVHTLPLRDHEFHDPHGLAELARSLGFQAEVHDSLEDALPAITRPARVLLFGSLYIAGEALAANGEAPD